MKQHSCFFIGTLLLLSGTVQSQTFVRLEKGMEITHSAVIERDLYFLNGEKSLEQPVLNIRGENITVDFNHAVLQGSSDRTRPDEYYGLAIRVQGKNVVLMNLNVHGYKVGIWADGVENLALLNSDLSYQYRPRLHSGREREDFSDWLSYHQNELDEWLRYGAAIYLKECTRPLVKGVRVTGCQNGLLMSACQQGFIYNNTIQFNSGLGIGLYRSSFNNISHNKLDWNVRGYSHGFYSRGQDSAGILVYEQSNNNTFAYNSATHSGDGFFLWAGQSTMESGTGGCNDNVLALNDFSFAPTNGIEVTFSRNHLLQNRMLGCTYGIWGGYSHETRVEGNLIQDCRTGLAIEHGQENAIRSNYFLNCETGIRLWEREEQPAGWGYASGRDVSSRDYEITANWFLEVPLPLDIGGSSEVLIDQNLFYHPDEVLREESPNNELQMVNNRTVEKKAEASGPGVPGQPFGFQRSNFDWDSLNRVMGNAWEMYLLADGMDVGLEEDQPRGRAYILMGEWGPYDFRRPAAWLRKQEGDRYTLELLGPEGEWTLKGLQGIESVSKTSGTLPDTVVVISSDGAPALEARFEFVGETAWTEFGERFPKGTPFPFVFRQFDLPAEWQVSWFAWNERSNPLENPRRFENLLKKKPLRKDTLEVLNLVNWGAPGEDLPADGFAAVAESTIQVQPGKYRITVTSDDGMRLILDGKVVLENWSVHEPECDEVILELGGDHRLEVIHFDRIGFSCLQFDLQPVW